MFTQVLKKTLFSRIISFIATLSLVLISVPMNYANTGALRTPAAKGRVAGEIESDLSKSIESKKTDILILSNIISLLEGAQTGGYNIEHAILDGANGGIFNHSERRGRLEIAMENMLGSIGNLINNGASYETVKNRWIKTLKTENLSDKEIEGSLGWFHDFYNGKQSVEYLARRLVNYIMNVQLQKVIAYSDKYKISQTVLCVGETLAQYEAKRTSSVLNEDLDQILVGITKEQAEKIGLRIAYEPRWAIGTGKTPTNAEIQKTHKFIKDTLKVILGIELDVDYGGSLNEKNCQDILALADVDGGLIGGAAKDIKKIAVIIDEAVRQGQIKNKLLNIGMNWKAEDKTTGLARLKEFAALFRTKDLSKVRIVISTPQVRTVRLAMSELIKPLILTQEEGKRPTSLGNPIPIINAYTSKDLEGKKVLLRVDFNVSDAKGNIKDVERLIQAIPTIVYLMQNGATVILTSHNGRPEGKVKMELSLGPVAERLGQLLKEQGYDIKVVFHKDSITDKGLAEGLKEKIEEGAINVLENTRFYSGEEENNEAFAGELAGLADNYMYVFDAFGTAERVHASTGGAAKFMDKLAIGFLVEKEYEYLEGAAKSLYGLIIGGGPKVSEKVPVVKNVIKNIKEGGFLIIGTGPVAAFLKLKYNVDIGQKPSAKDIDDAREIIRMTEEKKAEVLLPTDFVVTDRNLSEVADVEAKKTWLDLKKLPDGVNLYEVTLEQLKQGKFIDTGTDKELESSKLFVYDIGPKSAAEFGRKISGVKKGYSLFWNGSVGVDEMSEFQAGTAAVAAALSQATVNKATTVVGGGDTVNSAKKFGANVSHRSTGGGASLALLQGKKLAVIAELEKVEIDKFKNADETTYIATGGEDFSNYIGMVVEQRTKGDLSASEFKAEKIFDSRGNPTLRAILKIGDIEVIGEVPAGASKGKDEAPTVDIDKALSNINNEIAPALIKSGLDLSNYGDLLKADKMLAEKIKDWGANATVPLSWALWKMAARLNNMELWEYIRWSEPEVFANGPLYFYMNIYNGGLHALKAGEQLGRERIDIQEIMIAPVGAKNHGEALAMGDKIDQALKKILESDFAKSDITRADEAGFSVKGLGDSSEAIGYVLEAIKEAGYNPGVDVKLCLDVAATSFYNDKENVYEFRGNKLTSEQMIEYYRGLAEKYNGQIASIEDGLAENDWEGWTKLTEAMENYGILTIGDDLFVTQMPRITKGIQTKAATAILIKVNQNGTVGGTLEVIKHAKNNGLKFVISHRSGETLDNAIADLAYATRALGLKTGDPQPRVDFLEETRLVRRAKYERMVEIEKSPKMNGKVLIVMPQFFRFSGAVASLEEIGKLSNTLKFALYGEKAEKIKAWIGNENIITAKGLEELLSQLTKMGIESANMLVLKTAQDSAIDEAKIKELNIRQIVAQDITTLAVAKAVKELLGSTNAKDAFAKLLSEAEGKVIEKINNNSRQAILARLDEGTFTFPTEVKMTQQVVSDTEKARLISSEFMNRV